MMACCSPLPKDRTADSLGGTVAAWKRSHGSHQGCWRRYRPQPHSLFTMDTDSQGAHRGEGPGREPGTLQECADAVPCHAMLRGQSPCPQPLVAGSHRCVCLGHMTSRTKCSGQGEVAAPESQGQGSRGGGVVCGVWSPGMCAESFVALL